MPVQISLPSANTSSADMQQRNARHHQAQLHSNDIAEQHSATAVPVRAQPYSHSSSAETMPTAAHAATQLRERTDVKGSGPSFAAVEVPKSCEPAQFMSALSGLYGSTTPEQKRQREDKQKQYAQELDEQVGAVTVAVIYTWHAQRGDTTTCKCQSGIACSNHTGIDCCLRLLAKVSWVYLYSSCKAVQAAGGYPMLVVPVLLPDIVRIVVQACPDSIAQSAFAIFTYGQSAVPMALAVSAMPQCAVQIRLKQAAKSAERARGSTTSLPGSDFRPSIAHPNPQITTQSYSRADTHPQHQTSRQQQQHLQDNTWNVSQQQQQWQQSQQQQQQWQQQQQRQHSQDNNQIQQPQPQQRPEPDSPDATAGWAQHAQHGHSSLSVADRHHQQPIHPGQANTNRKFAAAGEGVAGVLGSDPPSIAPEALPQVSVSLCWNAWQLSCKVVQKKLHLSITGCAAGFSLLDFFFILRCGS